MENESIQTTVPVKKFEFSSFKKESAPTEPVTAATTTTTAESVEQAATTTAEVATKVEETNKNSKYWRDKLSLQGREQREREQRKAEKAQFEAEKAQFEAERKRLQTYEEARQNAKKNPIAALEAAGLSYDDLVSAYMDDGKPTVEKNVESFKSEISTMKSTIEDMRQAALKKEQDALIEQNTSVIADFRNSVLNDVSTAKDKYPLINSLGRSQDVLAVIENHFSQTGQLIDHNEAASYVESYLSEELPKQIEQYLADPKVKDIVKALLAKDTAVSGSTSGTKATTTTSTDKPTNRFASKKPVTITNSLTATTNTALDAGKKKASSWEEIRARSRAQGK